MKKTTDFSKADKLVDNLMRAGLQSLGNDIKKRAVVLAPKDTGALRQSAKVEVKKSDEAIISFNVPYSRIRHEINRLHPSTRKYLVNGLKSISDVSKYFPKF
jgi:hypothetical protein